MAEKTNTKGSITRAEKFQNDPYRKDYILFYEYFQSDNSAGLGASHQTRWTGPAAKLIEFSGKLDPEQLLLEGKTAAFAKVKSKVKS